MHFFCKKKTKQGQSVTKGSAIRDTGLLWSMKVYWWIMGISPTGSASSWCGESSQWGYLWQYYNHLSIYLFLSIYPSIYHPLVPRLSHWFVNLYLFITVCEPSPLDRSLIRHCSPVQQFRSSVRAVSCQWKPFQFVTRSSENIEEYYLVYFVLFK